jgi:ADP-ribosylglycohydrolase
MFYRWLFHPGSLRKPYNSYGNGSAMRVIPVGWACKTLEETLQVAKISAGITHNHIEGIKGAQATAASIFLARKGNSKEEIRTYIEQNFNYDLNRTCDEIRPGYKFNETCQGTVPEAIIAFLDSSDFENSIRLAVSLGGDSDTLACITGGIAEAFYGIPDIFKSFVDHFLTEDLKAILDDFYRTVLRAKGKNRR